MTELAPAAVPDRVLQTALEFAVSIAALGAKLRPPLPFPVGLKPFLKFHKLPPTALAAVRATVEGDDEYWRRLGIAAQAELVDEAGMVWLQRPEGWQQRLAELAASTVAAGDDSADARREQRRREAAEAVALRTRVELVEAREALAREREAAAVARRDLERAQAELRGARSRITELESGARRRSAGDGQSAAQLETAERERDELRGALLAAEAARDAALAARADEGAPVDLDRLRRLLAEALVISGGGVDPGRGRRGPRRHARQPLAIPGGLYGSSEAAAEHLLRTAGVMVLVDGYNVAKLGWPERTLEQQREACIDAAERLAKRWGTDLHLVFDGTTVAGAHTRRRRLVRVTFSPEGVIADDVLRAEVAALDPARPVVVVTNDQAVLADVRAAGANTLPSDTFLTLTRH